MTAHRPGRNLFEGWLKSSFAALTLLQPAGWLAAPFDHSVRSDLIQKYGARQAFLFQQQLGCDLEIKERWRPRGNQDDGQG